MLRESCQLVTDAKVDESFINSAALAGVKASVGSSENCTTANRPRRVDYIAKLPEAFEAGGGGRKGPVVS